MDALTPVDKQAILSALLPHLTQVVRLDRGQAAIIAYYLDAEQMGVLLRRPDEGQRMSMAEALVISPVEALLKKLDRLVGRDQKPLVKKKKGKKWVFPAPRAHRLKVKYNEMIAVRLYYARMLASAGCFPEHRDVLAGVLGRFHQPSLALERYIELPSATTYSR